ncbi:MAG: hypothetical protein GAK45_02134 [Pseudomonas citronellolis]|nr:MAG: hypothetical protein GAK45_02134 [Pseudomonas citronellolis]
MSEERPIASPCVYVCALDDDDVCTGCQRNIDEITRWVRMDNVERRQVLERCHQRAREQGLLL